MVDPGGDRGEAGDDSIEDLGDERGELDTECGDAG